MLVRQPDAGTVRYPLGVAEHDAAPAATLIYLAVQGPAR